LYIVLFYIDSLEMATSSGVNNNNLFNLIENIEKKFSSINIKLYELENSTFLHNNELISTIKNLRNREQKLQDRFYCLTNELF
jgi:Zn-dependent M16 (insulinase) family peptidase